MVIYRDKYHTKRNTTLKFHTKGNTTLRVVTKPYEQKPLDDLMKKLHEKKKHYHSLMQKHLTDEMYAKYKDVETSLHGTI